MENYTCYRFMLSLKSPFGTLWHSDTFLGHLAWIVAHQEGEDGVRAFLAPFIEGKPPFVLSDAFPCGLLPRPLTERRKSRAGDLDAYASQKAVRKAEFVRINDFDALRLGKEIETEPVPSPWVRIETLHASISRETGTTGEGGNLFTAESWTLRREFWEDNHARLAIYVYCQDGWIEKVEKMFSDLSMSGFGKDKSVGLGHFDFFKKEKWDGFKVFSEANGFVSLSTFAPAIDDPTDGQWAINVKYAKLGENAGNGNPFKKPIIQVKPGSVFRTGGNPRPFYGRVISGIAPGFPEAVQICYCLAVPCLLKNEDVKSQQM